jgi:hypothetical protein
LDKKNSMKPLRPALENRVLDSIGRLGEGSSRCYQVRKLNDTMGETFSWDAWMTLHAPPIVMECNLKPPETEK